MKRFPIIAVLLLTGLIMLVVSAPGHSVTNRVLLQIEGMT